MAPGHYLLKGGKGGFFLSQFFKIVKFNGDPPCILQYFSLTPPSPLSFLLVKWRFTGVIVLIIK
jgi:hypothetical protein